MTRLILGLCAGLFLMADRAGAQAGFDGGSGRVGERVELTLPDGFVLFSDAAEPNYAIVEYAAAGENDATWVEAVSIQTLGDWAGSDPITFLQGITPLLQEFCPGILMTPFERVARLPYEAALSSVDCPVNPESGRPESYLGLVIAGQDAVYMVQYGWRGPPDPAGLTRAYRVIASARLCDTRRGDAPCTQ